MYNRVILVGHLTRDVELKYTPNDTAIGQFGIATNRNYKNANTGENKQEVMFIDIKVFGKSAENANRYLHKGSKALVEGRLALEQWVSKSGQKMSKHIVIAEKIQFMDSKNQNNVNTPATQQRQRPQQQNIPSIDINEDEIPF